MFLPPSGSRPEGEERSPWPTPARIPGSKYSPADGSSMTSPTRWSALHREQFARGPTQVRSQLRRGRRAATRDGRRAASDRDQDGRHGEHQRVRESRMFLQVATAERFIATVETITGRTVRAFAKRQRSRQRIVTENSSWSRREPRRPDVPLKPSALAGRPIAGCVERRRRDGRTPALSVSCVALQSCASPKPIALWQRAGAAAPSSWPAKGARVWGSARRRLRMPAQSVPLRLGKGVLWVIELDPAGRTSALEPESRRSATAPRRGA
jgi:hypothetical protein